MYKYGLILVLLFGQAGVSQEHSFEVATVALAEERWLDAKKNIRHIQNKYEMDFLLSVYYMSKKNPDFDFKKGFELLESAAKNGYESAKFGLLLVYMVDDEPFITKDYQKAGELFIELYSDIENSALGGDIDSARLIAFAYDKGIGFKKDSQKAFNLYKELYENTSDKESMYVLARKYYFADGVDKDLLKSKELLIQLAESHYLNSEELLAVVNKELEDNK